MKTVEWLGDRIRLIDQTRLPGALTFIDCETLDEVAEAISSLKVRGAPAIGITAAFGLALVATRSRAPDLPRWSEDLERAADVLRRTRPTAVDLSRALEVVLQATLQATDLVDGRRRVLEAINRLQEQDRLANHAIGRHGADLVPFGANVLTHCNTGALATIEHGTALGVIRTAHAQGKRIHVWVDETRPALQGARLTAWELLQDGIPHTVVADGMAGFLMRQRKVDLILVGADRIAANGDTVNKVGTYALAVLARAHRLPFYVVAATSTFDARVPNGDAIPIEERSPDEIRRIGNVQIAPADSPALNLAFDVTPGDLVSAIVTERGVIRPPYDLRRSDALAVTTSRGDQ
ncbi:MAG: S-methyl-5-thioribose-1-phosphate isomerase [Chloroflexota bacterium]